MIQTLFFLRFKNQLHITRPGILARLEDAFNSAAAAAGGRAVEEHRFLSASFDENRIGFLIDMLLFIAGLKKNLEEAGRELSGHALVIGGDIPGEGREKLCRLLSSGAVSRHSGIWCDRRLRAALEPCAVFADAPERPRAADMPPDEAALYGEYRELKELVKPAGTNPQFSTSKKIARALFQSFQKMEGNVFLAGPPLAGKRGGVYSFCKDYAENIPPLVIRFGGGNPACFADALSEGMRSFLAQRPGGNSCVLEELDALGEFLFRERLRTELFPALLDTARRFLRLLLAAYDEAARSALSAETRAGDAADGARPPLPVIVLENIPVSGDAGGSLFREVFSGFDRRSFLVFGICSLPASAPPEDDPDSTKAEGRADDTEILPAGQLLEWGGFFPRVLKLSVKDFPAKEKSALPPAVPPFLWEVSYVFALLGRFFPARLFPRLFEEEGLNPKVPGEAMEMLRALALIGTSEDPVPRIPDFTRRAEEYLSASRGGKTGADLEISGKDKIRQMARNRLLAWVDSGKINPCFALLGILDELGGPAVNRVVGDALALRVIREDVYAGTYTEIDEAAESGGFSRFADRQGRGPGDGQDGSALLWIYRTLKALVWGDEKKLEDVFSLPPPEYTPPPRGETRPGFFMGFRAQILVNLGAYKLGRGEIDEAAKIIKEAMVVNQSVKDRAVSAYRLFSLVKLAGGHLVDALEYAAFAADDAEKTASAGKTARPDEFEEQIKTFYFVAVIHFIYGNLTKAERFALRVEESAGMSEGRNGRVKVSLSGAAAEWAAKARFLRGRISFECGAYDEALELFASLAAVSPEGTPPAAEPSDKDRTAAAWLYRARVFSAGVKGLFVEPHDCMRRVHTQSNLWFAPATQGSLGAKKGYVPGDKYLTKTTYPAACGGVVDSGRRKETALPAPPEFPGPDGYLFMAEAAFLTGDYEKAVSLAEVFHNKEGVSLGALNAKAETGGNNFFFTEQPDWRGGFSQCEDIIIRGVNHSGRLARVYRALAKSRLDVSAAEREETGREWQDFFRRELLPDGDPKDSFYYYAYYCILQKTGASRIDTGTAVSMAFKRLQRRAGRVENDKTRQSFLSANYWNSALCLAAKEYKLI